MRPFAALAVMLSPSLAWACPQCAGNSGGGVLFGVMLGAMILLPFPVFGIVYHVIKKGADAPEAQE